MQKVGETEDETNISDDKCVSSDEHHLVDERDSFVVLLFITEKCLINWRSLKMEKVRVNHYQLARSLSTL